MNIQGIPSLAAALTPAAASTASSAVGSAASGNSSTSSASQTANDAEQTFIQLLVTELQSQDPTSPMDPTTMVGQMFQMNQLQQLIDINQTLSTALDGGAPSSANLSSSAVSSNSANSLFQTPNLSTNAAASYAQQLLTGAH